MQFYSYLCMFIYGGESAGENGDGNGKSTQAIHIAGKPLGTAGRKRLQNMKYYGI